MKLCGYINGPVLRCRSLLMLSGAFILHFIPFLLTHKNLCAYRGVQHLCFINDAAVIIFLSGVPSAAEALFPELPGTLLKRIAYDEMMVPVGKEYQVFLTVHSPVRYDGYLLKSVKLASAVRQPNPAACYGPWCFLETASW